MGAGLEPSDAFNAVARAAIRWTYEALSDDNRDWLAELPAGPLVVDDLLEICHGTPFDEDMYVFDDADVLRSMQAPTGGCASSATPTCRSATGWPTSR